VVASACGGGRPSSTSDTTGSDATETTQSTDTVPSTDTSAPASSTTAAPGTTQPTVRPTTTSRATAPPTTPKPTQKPTTTAKAKPKVAYPAGGAVDPVFPPNDDAYGMLVQGQCAQLLQKVSAWQSQGVVDVEGQDTVFLYRSIAEACLQRWSDAIADFDRLTKPQPVFDSKCGRTEAYKWLAALIAQRKADPAFTPEFVPGTGRSPCATTATTTTSTTSRPSTTTSTAQRTTTTSR
jgi:hypothetical protein